MRWIWKVISVLFCSDMEKPFLIVLKSLAQQRIESTTGVERIQVITAANVLRINKNLWNRCATTALDHLFAFNRVTIDRQFLERYAFAGQQRFRSVAERARCFGVDLNIGHHLSPYLPRTKGRFSPLQPEMPSFSTVTFSKPALCSALADSCACMPVPSTTIIGWALCFSSSPMLFALISAGSRLIAPAMWPLRKSSR